MPETIPMLGKLIVDLTAERDAVHIAVAPMIATENLTPGQRVGIVSDGKAGPVVHHIGIVDPFLDAPYVPEGERFWLFLYPNTITSLKHLWTHPAFKDLDVRPDGGEYSAAKDVQKATSEAWLRNFCKHADCPDYDDVMAAIGGTLKEVEDYGPGWGRMDGDYMFFSGRDAHGDIPDEFWDHAEIVLGRRLRDKPRHFSCSC